MKIVFLDIDGVLNNPGCYAQPDGSKKSGSDAPADPRCVAALNRILDATGAWIVVSSTWKLQGLMFCRERLAEWGIRERRVIDVTPNLQALNLRRGDEIQKWIDSYERNPIEAFVILDDEGPSSIGDLSHRLVQTQGHVGLTDADAEHAIALLAHPDKKAD